MSESTLSEIMSRDPNKCSRQDIDIIIDFYRKSRKQFAAGGFTTAPKKVTAKTAALTAAVGNVELDL